jgi:hypothetical protein
MLAEKSNNFRVKPTVEVNAIKTRRVSTDDESLLNFLWSAGREEGKVLGIFDEMIIRFGWEPSIDIRRTAAR